MASRKDSAARISVWAYVWAIALSVIILTMAFGNPLKPVLLMMLSRVNLPGSVVYSSIIGGLLAAVVAVWLIVRQRSEKRSLGNGDPALFVVLAMSFALLIATIETSIWRNLEIERFAPDEVYTNPFLRSLYETPREFQFYLHAAALKDCVPYAWSYREMRFYRLPNNVAVNVLPSRWIENCDIRRVR